MTVEKASLQAVRAPAASKIWGTPGVFARTLSKVMEGSGTLPLYTLSHEPAVGFAADAAARLRSAPAVAAVTYGAGGLNMVNAVAAAYGEKAPGVVIPGPPGRRGSGRRPPPPHQGNALGPQ